VSQKIITPIFDTVIDTVMDMVIMEYAGDISNLSNFLLVDPAWCIQSIVLALKDGLTAIR